MTKIPTNLPPISSNTAQGADNVGQPTGATSSATATPVAAEPDHVPQTVAGNPLDPNLSLRRDGAGGSAMIAMQAGAKMDADWTKLGTTSQGILQQLGRMDNDTLNSLFDDWSSDRVWTA